MVTVVYKRVHLDGYIDMKYIVIYVRWLYWRSRVYIYFTHYYDSKGSKKL